MQNNCTLKICLRLWMGNLRGQLQSLFPKVTQLERVGARFEPQSLAPVPMLLTTPLNFLSKRNSMLLRDFEIICQFSGFTVVAMCPPLI